MTEIERERRRLHDLLMRAPAIICVLRGPEHRFELANQHYLRLIGRTAPEQVLGKTLREALPELEGQGYFEILDRVFATGQPFVGAEMKVALARSPGGALDEVFLNFVYEPTLDAEGMPDGVMVHGTDITEHVRRRQEIEELAGRLAEERDRSRASEQNLRAVVDTTPECVKLVARDGTLLHINASGLAMIEADPAAVLVGKNIYELIAPEHRERFRQFNEAVCGGARGRLEFDLIGLQGGRRNLESHAAPLRIADGTIAQLALTRDVTEHRLASEALRQLSLRAEQERRLYETILSNTPDLIYVFGLDHRFTYANQALLAMWGRTWDDAMGKNCLELGYEPWHAAMHDREIDQVIATKRPIRGVVPFSGVNGRRVYDYIFVPVISGNGEVEAVAGTTRDITELKRKEEMLQFFANLDAATQPLSNPDEIMSVAARFMGEYLGVNRCAYAEIEAESVFVVTGDYLKDVSSMVGRWPLAAFGAECTRLMLANQRFVVVDARHDPRIGPEDLPVYAATNIAAMICVPLHKAGRFTAAMAVHQRTARQWTADEIALVERVVARCWDSLERARTLRSLQLSEQRLRFMAESMPQKIFSARATGEVDYVNPQWLEFTGRRLPELLDWGWLQFVHADDRAEHARRWQHSIATGEPFQLEHRFLRHDGVYRWHLTRAHAMRDPAGNVLMWIGSNTEIEEQKRAEEELELMVAERTVRLRETIGELEAFSYSIAHDLRAPLRSLQGFSDILMTDHAEQLDAQGKGFLRRIGTAAGRMDKLIQDVLNYSRIVRAELPRERVDLEHLLRSIVETYPMFAPDKTDITLTGPFPTVLGNEAMLTQIFSNLLGNAVKFVAPGVMPRIHISAEAHERHVRVMVQDNGIGVPADQHKKIFEIFQQATSAYGGTGIGLAIVKKAVERMGGQIGVSSEPGKGSTFWVEIQRG